jgi:hypothetical protein
MLNRPCSETVAGIILVVAVMAAMWLALAFWPK